MNRGDTAIYEGYEVCLWPLEYVGITANPYSDNHIVQGVSNSGLYDNGWYLNQVRELYAPCSMELVAYSSSGNTQVWRSIDKVWIPSSSEPVYISIGVAHSNTLPYTQIGTVIGQGTHFYNTGNAGASAYHVHFILELGSRSSNFPVGYNAPYGINIFYSPNPPTTIADMFYLTESDDIRNSGGYDWKRWQGITPPSTDSSLLAILYMELNKRRKKNGKRLYT